MDAAVKVYVNADIRARVGDTVHHHCSHSCGSDVDAGILADITALIKVNLGKILVDLDADVLVDIRVRLNALGLKIKADVDLHLGLDLGAILGDLLGDCRHAHPAIMADLKLAINAAV